jgi:3-oxoacyl-[acyl-carrier-protein] synthase II
MNKRRVVVTGIGALTPIGNNIEEFWGNLLNGVSGAAPITHFNAEKFKTHFACEIKNFDAGEILGRKEVRRLDPVMQYSLVASDEAIKDAGLDTIENKKRIGVFWASGIGGIDTLHTEIVEYAKGDGTPRFTPFLVPKMIVDASAGNISIRHGFTGPSAAIVTACASSTHCIGLGYDQILLGRADVMVVGGAEAAIGEVGVGAFNALKALSTRNNDPVAASRPFDKDRDGFVIGEGAGCLVIEELEHAKARGAKIYAEIIGVAQNADAFHITAPNPDGTGVIELIRLVLNDAGIKPEEVDYINPHSTSTDLGDIAETNAIKNAFGDAIYNIHMSATKSMTGHLISAAGAVESIVCIKSINEGKIAPTINFNEFDPQIDANLKITPNKMVEANVDIALNINYGFGGHNSAVIFKKYKV